MLARQPALDGVRAIAVTMVLLFHGGVPWMRGGYFGVSVFFTLSGFLITSLLVREFDSTARIAPGAFYARRAKRLLPASTMCLAVVSLMAAGDAWLGAGHLRRDVLGALFQVANWVQLGGGGSYTDLQRASAGLRSPLDHYWSLAIEEQFYWLWPLAFWGLAGLRRRFGWSLTRIMLVLTAVFAAAAPAIALIWGRDAAYWATPARAAEIFIGALLAVALREGLIEPRRWMAPVCLGAVVAIAVVLPADGGPAYHGAFPLLALASGGLLLGLQRHGHVTAALAWRPVVGLGAISYGVYLFHFPVYVFVSAERLGRSGWQLLVVRIAITLAVAVVSYWLIEQPIRQATWTRARTTMNAVLAVGLVMVAIVVVPDRDETYWHASEEAVSAAQIPAGGAVVALAAEPQSPRSTTSVATTAVTSPAPTASTGSAASVASAALTGRSVPATTAPATTAPATTAAAITVPSTTVPQSTMPAIPVMPVLNRPVRIIVVGDSTAQATGAGLIEWAARNPEVAKVTVLAAPGCGFIRGGTIPTDGDAPFTEHCNNLLDRHLPDALRELQPDVVMLMTTIRDVEPRLFEPDEGLLTPLDSRFVNRARVDYRAITDLILSTSDAHLAWLKPPHIDAFWQGESSAINDPVAHSVMEVLMGSMTAHTDRVVVLDLHTWLGQAGLADDHAVRPDGIHFAPAAALDIATRWLGPQLVIEAMRPTG